MTHEEAGRRLRHRYDGAPRGNKALAVILFGVQYGEEMMEANLVAAEVARQAGLKKWGPTLSGAMKLAEYVVRK